MKHRSLALVCATLCAITQLNATGTATIKVVPQKETAYYQPESNESIKTEKQSAQRVYNQFGKRPLLPEKGAVCSFTVQKAYPHRDVILDICAPQKKEITTVWRLTLGAQRESTDGSGSYTCYSSIEHLGIDTGKIIESHEVKHAPGKPFIEDGQRFHIMFEFVRDPENKKATTGFNVLAFEVGKKTPFLDKKFSYSSTKAHYLVPASGSSKVTYANFVLRKIK